MKWESHKLQQLVECLVGCSHMRYKENRNRIVDQLPQRIDPTTITRADTDQQDVIGIVSRCSEYPGGIETLIRLIHWFEKDTESMIEVWKCLSSIFMPENKILQENKWFRNYMAWFLHFSSMIKMEGRDAIPAYEAAVPVTIRDQFDLSSPKDSGLWIAVFELCDVPVQGGSHSLLFSFLNDLSLIIKKDQQRAEFVDWLSKMKQKLGHEETGNEKRIGSKTEHNPPYVLLNLRPKTTQGSANFHATVYIWRSSVISAPKKDFEGEENKIAEQLEKWVTDFFSDEDDQPKCIEVFLPGTSLFNIRPHLWHTCQNSGLIPSRLGCDYPTVVRIDRKSGARTLPQFRALWKSKWKHFHELTKSDPTMKGCDDPWVEEKEADDVIALYKKCRLKEADPIMLAPFQPKTSKKRPGLAQVLLQSGIPVAIWGDVTRKEMEGLLENIQILNLPDSLRELMLKSTENDPGFRVTLLWDDPERELPSAIYEPENIEFNEDGLYGPNKEGLNG